MTSGGSVDVTTAPPEKKIITKLTNDLNIINWWKKAMIYEGSIRYVFYTCTCTMHMRGFILKKDPGGGGWGF